MVLTLSLLIFPLFFLRILLGILSEEKTPVRIPRLIFSGAEIPRLGFGRQLTSLGIPRRLPKKKHWTVSELNVSKRVKSPMTRENIPY